MTLVDFGIIGVIGTSFFWSFRRGLIMELVSFFSFIFGFLGSFMLYPIVSPFFIDWLGGSTYGKTVSFGLVFIGIAGLTYLIGVLLHKFVHAIHLGIFNRILGGCFGVIKASIIISIVLVMMLGIYGEERPDYLKESYLSSIIVKSTTSAMEVAPFLFDSFLNDYGIVARKYLPGQVESDSGSDSGNEQTTQSS